MYGTQYRLANCPQASTVLAVGAHLLIMHALSELGLHHGSQYSEHTGVTFMAKSKKRDETFDGHIVQAIDEY